VQCAGFADAARRFLSVPLLIAGLAAGGLAFAQSSAAQQSYAAGVKALNERRFHEARELLQQAVQADPGFAGAWLDLALATFADGDYVQAEEFLGILEQRFVVPQNIAQGIAGLRARIQAQAPSATAAAGAWQWRRTLQAGLGYDTNANAGLARSDLTLTFPGGGITLPVAESFRPRKDAYAIAGVGAEGARRLGDGQLEATGSLKARRNAQVRDFDTVELQGSVAYATSGGLFQGALASALPGPWRFAVNAQQAYLGGNVLLNSLGASATHAWPGLACRPQGSVELEFRKYPVATNLDSQLAWLGLQGSCPSPWAGSGGRLNLQVRLGQEMAQHDFASSRGRPGGDTHHAEITVSHPWTWAGQYGTHRLEALGQWAQARDTEGYSPLLADNARRHVTRTTVGISYTWPLQAQSAEVAGWQATLTAQAYRQQSNLEIFRLKGEVIQLSFQRGW
jgi:tetratricopeptide (TPR) repeat protein